MKINRLIDSHHKSSDPRSILDNFGDGYLLKTNRIFRNIRLRTLECGFVYHSEPSADFQALPLSQLEAILSSKQIPYTNNVAVLDKLVIKLRDQFNWEDISIGYKRNYVFHESCHAVARSEAVRLFKNKSELKTADEQNRECLQLLIQESFANACELLAVIDAEDQVHKFFYQINSYSSLFENRTHLKTAYEKMGDKFVFEFFLICYLFSNFLHQGLSEKQFDQILKLVTELSETKISSEDIKNLKILAKIPFTLDLNFRITTTGLYFRLLGLNRQTRDLLKYNFLETIESDILYRKFIDSISKQALGH